LADSPVASLAHPQIIAASTMPATTDSANIARHLPLMAARQPNHPALKIPRGRTRAGDIDYLTLTFAELDAEVAAWAARITAAGVKTDDRVLVMVRQGLPLIAAAFALFKIGAVPVVIDPGMGLKSFLTCVERTQPRALLGIPLARIISRVFRKPFRNVTIRIPASSSPTSRLSFPGVGGVPSPRIDVARGEGTLPTTNPNSTPSPLVPSPSPVVRSATDLAAILFTSGSTGAPKGVCYEHGMFEAQVRLIRATYGIQPGEVDLPMLPIFALFNPALGMTTIVPEIDPARPAAVDPAKIVQAIRQENVTNSFGSPTLWAKIADHCLRTNTTLPSLRRVLCAGAPVPETLWENSRHFLTHGQLHSPYGATEALPIASVCAAEIIPRTTAFYAAAATSPSTTKNPSTTPKFPAPSPAQPIGKTSAPSGECHVLRDTSQSPFSLEQPGQCHVIRDTFSAPHPGSQLSYFSVSGSATPGACVGRPLPGIDVRIIAITDTPIATIAEARELRPGEIGEIIVRGPVVTKAYDALPEATAAAKIQTPNAKSQKNPNAQPSTQSSTATPPASDFGVWPLAFEISSGGSAAIWHRMGDCGYFDPLGRLWFCGRKVERVLTEKGPLFTEPCEQVFRSHPQVARCALIGLGVPGNQLPALVIERRKIKSNPPLSNEALARELRSLATAYASTADITRFYFHKNFPVDVRHNAKIHRLTLAKWAAAHEAQAIIVS
jgi:acyl-CoA synthetase (AMP-forming)/AMP-acid ligase II